MFASEYIQGVLARNLKGRRAPEKTQTDVEE